MSTLPELDASPCAQDYFQQLADGVPVLIWMSGLDMGCFYFNRAWLDYRGRTLAQEAGNGWAEGVHPDDLQRCVSHYVACFERRLAFAMSYRLQHRSGAHRWILDRGAPHFLPDGTFLGFFGGCAEIENDVQISRHAELGVSMNAMRSFVRQIATEVGAGVSASNSTADTPLHVAVRQLHESREDRELRMQHAMDEMNRLTADMLAFRRIAKGACLP